MRHIIASRSWLAVSLANAKEIRCGSAQTVRGIVRPDSHQPDGESTQHRNHKAFVPMAEDRGIREAAARRSALHRCDRSAIAFPCAAKRHEYSDVTYRLAREDDLSAMRLIQSKALYDLVVTRSGRPPSAITITDEPSTEMRHLLQTDPKLAWVSMEGGRAIGFSVGLVRGDLWFLSDLFVLPEAYGKGIGGELLRRCLAAGIERGARIRAVASSHDLSAQKALHRGGNGSALPAVRHRRCRARSQQAAESEAVGEGADRKRSRHRGRGFGS